MANWFSLKQFGPSLALGAVGFIVILFVEVAWG